MLSVCIPTYNRLDYLRECLDSLLPQAEKLGVQVCVSDNHSDDGTGEYLQELSQRFVCLSVARQVGNLGLERNMLKAIAMASGSNWVMPIGDDEVLEPECLEVLLREIDCDDDLLILNGVHVDDRGTVLHSSLPEELCGQSFTDLGAAFLRLWNRMPPGGFAARAHCCQEPQQTRYLGTSHAYSGGLWEALATRQQAGKAVSIRCLSDPLVRVRQGVKSWTNARVAVLFEEIPAWFQILAANPVYRKAADEVLNGYLQNQFSLRPLLQMRRSGHLRFAQGWSVLPLLDWKHRLALIATTLTPRWFLGREGG